MPANDPPLDQVADDFLARYRAGERPSIDAYASKYPEHADDIHQLLSSIALMEQFSETESELRELANDSAKEDWKPLQSLGQFDITHEIGRGGMGVVYEATDRALGRRVALKVLHASALKSDTQIERFRRESQLAAKLHHTNIVSVFGIGEEDGSHFYAMQFVDGVTVESILDRLRKLATNSGDPNDQTLEATVAAALKAGQFANALNPDSNIEDSDAMTSTHSGSTSKPAATRTVEFSMSTDTNLSATATHPNQSNDEPVPEDSHSREELVRESSPARVRRFDSAYWRSVARIGIQVADALHYAHVNGIMHRDIKPANLLFDRNGTIWVTDFGLAKLAEVHDLTQSGDVVGTLRYMAPEQLSGNADSRTDVYALGLTLYELLTLQPVCDGETYKQLFNQKQSHSFEPPRRIDPSIPRDLETIVQKSLEFEPNKRYASASILSEDLQRFLDDRPILARRVSSSERAWRWCRRNRVVAVLAAFSAVLMIALPLILGWAYFRETKQRRQTERTLGVALAGFDELYGSFLHDEHALSNTLASDQIDANAETLAPATLTKDTARILERMLVVYDQLAQESESSSNQLLLIESAKARRRVGDLYRRLGQFSEAMKEYNDAIRRYEQSVNSNPIDRAVEIARIKNAIGEIYSQREEHRLAEDAYWAAHETLEAIPFEQDARAVFELARTHYLIGKKANAPQPRRHEPGPPRGPRPPHNAGPGARRPPEPRHRPGDGPSRRPASHRHIDVAVYHLRTLLLNENTAAELNAEYRLLLALCLREMSPNGIIREGSGSNRAQAADLLNELVDEFPDVPRYRFELSETYGEIDENQIAPHDIKFAIRQVDVARQLAEQLVVEYNHVASFQINLAHIYSHLGRMYETTGDFRRAEEYDKRAFESHRKVVDNFPGLAMLSEQLSAGTQIRLARLLLTQTRWEEAVEATQPLADRLHEKLAELDSNDLSRRGIQESLNQCIECLTEAYYFLNDTRGDREMRNWRREQNSRSARTDPLAHALDANSDDVIAEDELAAAAENLLSLDDDHDGAISHEELSRRIPPRMPGPVRRFFQAPGYLRGEIVRGLLSFDENSDDQLTREELPPRMRREWFRRADGDFDDCVTETELRWIVAHPLEASIFQSPQAP